MADSIFLKIKARARFIYSNPDHFRDKGLTNKPTIEEAYAFAIGETFERFVKGINFPASFDEPVIEDSLKSEPEPDQIVPEPAMSRRDFKSLLG
jgi:hypothetical protein